MFESQRIIFRNETSRNDRSFLQPPSPEARAAKQRRAMLAALILLVIALGTILYVDRDFWFPPDQEAEYQPPDAAPTAAAGKAASRSHSSAHKKGHAQEKNRVESAAAAPASDGDSPVNVTDRTAIPPLEVQVIGAGSRRTLHPGSNAVRINLESESEVAPAKVPTAQADPPANDPPANDPPAASLTSNAAEHVRVSAETPSIVTHSVTPGYPLLARQMKVQGSVILQAMIGRDGLIEDLHVVSGPPVLASAAQEAVRQWHFRPHYQGVNPVETQTKITVNFTISTN